MIAKKRATVKMMVMTIEKKQREGVDAVSPLGRRLGLTATEKMPAEEEDFQANGCF